MSTPSTPAPSGTAKATSKSAKASRKIVFKLSPALLSQFPSAQPSRKASRSKPPINATVTEEAKSEDTTPQPNKEDSDKTKEADVSTASNAAAPNDDDSSLLAPPPVNGQKRKQSPTEGAKTNSGTKQATESETNGAPKPKGKPGPKRRKGLEGENGPNGAPAPVPHHKLGPKANTGAINAGLRALDRSGKPCRRWNRKGFNLQSFTGVKWDMPSWKTHKPVDTSFNGDVKSDSTGSSEAKKEHASSAVQSDKSNGGADANAQRPQAPNTDVASSPAPAPAPPTEAAAA